MSGAHRESSRRKKEATSKRCTSVLRVTALPTTRKDRFYNGEKNLSSTENRSENRSARLDDRHLWAERITRDLVVKYVSCIVMFC